MSGRLARFQAALDELGSNGRRRDLRENRGHDFASNDYLGLAGSPELAASIADAVARGVPVGSTGSRLLRGNHPEHDALESEAASFFCAERCLFFGSGYAANVALFATLPQRGDLVVFDALSHASAREGFRGGRADTLPARHNDADHVATLIHDWRTGGGMGVPWIAVESVYSMDGDCAPLTDLLAIAERHDGFLVVDEAHATGVLGAGGRGLAAELEGRDAVITLHTCGKALGVAGALVAASATLIDFMVNRARPFIYSTAPPPLVAAAVRAALRLIDREPERRERLAELVAFAGERIERRIGLTASGTHILPVMLGGDRRALEVAARLQSAGFDCRAIRPPTVPEGTARLRISITLNIDAGIVAALVDEMAKAGLRDGA